MPYGHILRLTNTSTNSFIVTNVAKQENYIPDLVIFATSGMNASKLGMAPQQNQAWLMLSSTPDFIKSTKSE